MTRLAPIALAAAAAVGLSGCAGFDFAAYAKAANELDPGCYKNVHMQVQPLLLPGWVVPVVSGSYDKVCNPDQAAASPKAASVTPLVLGGLVQP